MVSKKEKEKRERVKRIKEERKKRNAMKKREKNLRHKHRKTEKRLRRRYIRKLEKKGIKIKKERYAKGKYRNVGIKIKTIKGKRPKVEDVLQRGVNSVTIKDLYKVPDSELNRYYLQLLKKAVPDNGIRKIMAREEMIQKIRWRFSTKMTLYDMNGQKLGEVTRGSGGDLLDAKRIVNEHFYIGKSVYDEMTKRELPNGYRFRLYKKGNVERIELKLTMKKG